MHYDTYFFDSLAMLIISGWPGTSASHFLLRRFLLPLGLILPRYRHAIYRSLCGRLLASSRYAFTSRAARRAILFTRRLRCYKSSFLPAAFSRARYWRA